MIFIPRPTKFRKVCCMPDYKKFGPLDNKNCKNKSICLFIDELETIRLIDFEGLSQEKCAEQMGVARTTVQGIYVSARKKIADSLINGKKLLIDGGSYVICNRVKNPCGKVCKNFKNERGYCMKKIAIACDGEILSQHFGKTPEFRIYKIENQNYELVDKFVNEGYTCHDLPSILKQIGIEALVVGGMGANPENRLKEMDIEVFLVKADKVENIIKKLASGDLISNLSTCREHDHKDESGSCCHK